MDNNDYQKHFHQDSGEWRVPFHATPRRYYFQPGDNRHGSHKAISARLWGLGNGSMRVLIKELVHWNIYLMAYRPSY
jgi:hypothetical protein